MSLMSKNSFSNGLGHTRSKVSGTWAETESFHIKFPRSALSFVSNNDVDPSLSEVRVMVGVF